MQGFDYDCRIFENGRSSKPCHRLCAEIQESLQPILHPRVGPAMTPRGHRLWLWCYRQHLRDHGCSQLLRSTWTNRVWGLGARVCGGPLAVILQAGKSHKLCTYILTDISLVDWNVHFPKSRQVCIFIILSVSEMLTHYLDFRKPLHRKPIQQQPFNDYSSTLYTHIFAQTKLENATLRKIRPRLDHL